MHICEPGFSASFSPESALWPEMLLIFHQPLASVRAEFREEIFSWLPLCHAFARARGMGVVKAFLFVEK